MRCEGERTLTTPAPCPHPLRHATPRREFSGVTLTQRAILARSPGSPASSVRRLAIEATVTARPAAAGTADRRGHLGLLGLLALPQRTAVRNLSGRPRAMEFHGLRGMSQRGIEAFRDITGCGSWRGSSGRVTTAGGCPRRSPGATPPACTILTSSEPAERPHKASLSSCYFSRRGQGATHPAWLARTFGVCGPQPPEDGAGGPRTPDRGRAIPARKRGAPLVWYGCIGGAGRNGGRAEWGEGYVRIPEGCADRAGGAG